MSEKKPEVGLCNSCQKINEHNVCIPDMKNIEYTEGEKMDCVTKCSEYKPVTNNNNG